VTLATVSDPVSEVIIEEPSREHPVVEGDAPVLTEANTEIESEQQVSNTDDAVAEVDQAVLEVSVANMADNHYPEVAEVSERLWHAQHWLCIFAVM
jgi:hypothetical protein